MKYSALGAIAALLVAGPVQAQMPYMEEVKALGAVAGQGLACGSEKYDTFELLARAILISKAPNNKLQADAMYAYNEAKANAYVSKQMDGFYECAGINRRFDRQDIFRATLYRDGTIKMPDGKIITPRQPYDATLIYNKATEVDADAIYHAGGNETVGEIRIKSEGSPQEVRAIYNSAAEQAVSVPVPAAYDGTNENALPSGNSYGGGRRSPAADSGIGHLKSRWRD